MTGALSDRCTQRVSVALQTRGKTSARIGARKVMMRP
jgi:hypothetical protein